MEYKEFVVSFKYWENEIPPKCRKPRPVHYEDSITVQIRSVTSEEAPIALIQAGEDSGGDKQIINYKWFGGNLWTREVRDWNNFKADKLHAEPTEYALGGVNGGGYNGYEGRDLAVATIMDKASDYLYIDGEVHMTVPEPMYRVSFYSGRGWIDVAFDYGRADRRESYWPVTRRMDAIRAATIRQSEEPHIACDIAVLIPEAVTKSVYSERVIHKSKLVIEFDLTWAEISNPGSTVVEHTEADILGEIEGKLHQLESDRLYPHAAWIVNNLSIETRSDKRTMPCLLCGADTAPEGSPQAGLADDRRCPICRTWMCPACEDRATGWCHECARNEVRKA